jgi:hypothetical protein
VTTWLANGEKYGLIGLSVKIEQPVPFREIKPGLWVWTDQRLDVPTHWREWIGSIRAQEIEGCNLALLCKMPSATPGIFDGENQLLQWRVWEFYVALLLSSTFTPSHRPIFLTGAHHDGEIDVRQESALDTPALNIFRHYPPILLAEIDRAAALARQYEQLVRSPSTVGTWRIVRALSVYVAARTVADPMDRLHQYCRCIDGLILSEPGSGQKQFKSRTELFIGPRDHDLMGKLYAIRSDIEHLNEHKYLEVFDRAQMLDLVQKEAIADHIARHALAHIIGTPSLWQHFGNTAALAPFWQLPLANRQKLWGPATIKTEDALVGYDQKDISDGALGKR